MDHLTIQCRARKTNRFQKFRSYPSKNIINGLILTICFSMFSISYGQGGNHFSGHFAGHNYQGTYSALFGRFIAYNGGSGGCIGSHNSIFGIDAGIDLEFGSWNSYFGDEAGASNKSGNNNTYIGAHAGRRDHGSGNTFVGASTGHNSNNISNTGDNNSYFGYFAGRESHTGSRNSFFGAESGLFNAASNNSFLGYRSGRNNTTGDNNAFFGANAGGANTIGNRNTYLGTQAGINHFGNGNVFIGYQAGPVYNFLIASSGDNKLYINNDDSSTPLIYGEFDNRLIRIHGEFEAMGGVSSSSDFYAKEAIVNIDYQHILRQIDQLHISEWQYKDYPDSRHIGPMAQDFFTAFGLGSDDTKISTIDADGVALAALKALIQENEKLEKQLSDLMTQHERILELLKLENLH